MCAKLIKFRKTFRISPHVISDRSNYSKRLRNMSVTFDTSIIFILKSLFTPLRFPAGM